MQIQKQLGERLKPNHINNYVKQKYSKHTYEKAEIVQLDKKDSTTYWLEVTDLKCKHTDILKVKQQKKICMQILIIKK